MMDSRLTEDEGRLSRLGDKSWVECMGRLRDCRFTGRSVFKLESKDRAFCK